MGDGNGNGNGNGGAMLDEARVRAIIHSELEKLLLQSAGGMQRDVSTVAKLYKVTGAEILLGYLTPVVIKGFEGDSELRQRLQTHRQLVAQAEEDERRAEEARLQAEDLEKRAAKSREAKGL